MNITLIIGNGFDLNLGLPTSYKHFYEYYLSPQHEDNNRKIREIMEKDLPNWADLEIQLGAISSEYQDADSYIDDIDDVSEKLVEYMQVVDDLDIPSFDEFASTVYNDICDFACYLDTAQKNNLEQFIQAVSNKDEIHLDVITFNYTSTFERIFESWRKNSIHGKIKEYTLYHIHQKLDEHGILLGVNDVSQIANESFRQNYEVKAAIVKPFANSAFQAGIDKACEEAITHADIIILFGTSIGKTDQYWWNFIDSSMNGNRKRLVYCPFDEEPTAETRKILRMNYRYTENIVRRMSLDTNGRENVSAKILPIRGNQMFNYHVNQKPKMELNFRKVKIILKNKSNQ